MPKSSYPNKIDSSVELPIVRNNVTEINSEILNSLRDAILQIEKTLGINPNGSSTVAERISNVLDTSGFLKKEALDMAGVLYGPIINENISKLAGIDESKLKLNFPTQLLQTEIVLVKSEIDKFLSILDEINIKLSTHISESAINRHNSNNISVVPIASGESDTSIDNFEQSSLTDALKSIAHGHIGFSGETSLNNKSHSASQIYFNNENINSLTSSQNLQGVVEDLALSSNNQLKNSFFNTNSSGITRQTKISDKINSVDGKLKLNTTNVSYSATPNSKQLLTITTPVEPEIEIEKYDIVQLISGVSDIDDNNYLLIDFTLSGSLLTSVTILNGTKNDSNALSSIRIIKNPYQYSNLNAYNTTVRPRYNRTNTPDIIVSHPSSATFITKGIVTEKINSTKSTISIEVDGDTFDIPVYNSSRGDTNTIDEIILNINEYVSDNKIPVFAYKYRDISCYEIAISHVIPTWIDTSKNRIIIPRLAALNDCSEEFGISDIIDTEIYGSYGNSILLNGSLVEDLNTINIYDDIDVSTEIGTNIINFTSLNPISEGIKIGNLCYIDGQGLHRVSSVSSSFIELDNQGSLFSTELSGKIFIIKNTISLEDIEFSEIVGSDGALLIDLFMTEEFHFGYSIRAAIEGNLKSNTFSGIIFDISKGYLVNQTNTISMTTGGVVSVFDGTLTSEGDQIYGSGEYIIRSPTGSGFYRMQAFGSLPLSSSLSVDITGYEELPLGLIPLSRCLYSTAFGNVIGDIDLGIPSVLDKRPSGTVNEVIISPSVIEKYITGPRGELRDDGVVSGVSFSISDENTNDCNISINPGFYYNSGIRYKFNGAVDLPVVHNGDSFFVGLDSSGCLRIGTSITDPVTSNDISPFYGEKIAYIGYFIPDISGNINSIDLRKNISFIDKKINQIIVAEEIGAGHFSSIKDAINYARYYKMFNKSNSIPSILIKNGTYEIDETIVIDFDLQIFGSGPATILRAGDNLLSNSNSEEITLSDYRSAMFLIGSLDDSNANQSSKFSYGVRISNLTCTYHNGFSIANDSNFNFYFLITQGLSNSDDIKIFKFDNITFEGSSSMSESSSNTSLDGVRQIIPVAFGLASDATGTIPTNFGNLMISNCISKYIGTGWAFSGGIISQSGTYSLSNIIINGNIFRKCSPTQTNISLGNYEIFNSSGNYSMSGSSPATISMTEISVSGNVLTD